MKIFLSYSREDLALVEPVAMVLEQENHNVFFDRHSFVGGENYTVQIRNQIEQSNFFVFFVSEHSIANGTYALSELMIATKSSCDILPVCLDDTSPDEAPASLRVINWFYPAGNLTADLAAHFARKPEKSCAVTDADADAILSILRKEIYSWRESDAEASIEELAVYMDTVERQASTVAKIWRQVHTELAIASLDKSKWKLLAARYDILCDPNSFDFYTLRKFQAALERHIPERNSHDEPINQFVDLTREIIECRGDALRVFRSIVSQSKLPVNSESQLERIFRWIVWQSKMVVNRNNQLNELRDIVNRITERSADISAVAVAVNTRLATRGKWLPNDAEV